MQWIHVTSSATSVFISYIWFVFQLAHMAFLVNRFDTFSNPNFVIARVSFFCVHSELFLFCALALAIESSWYEFLVSCYQSVHSMRNHEEPAPSSVLTTTPPCILYPTFPGLPLFFCVKVPWELFQVEQIDSLSFSFAEFRFVMSDFQMFLFSFWDRTGTFRILGRCDNQ